MVACRWPGWAAVWSCAILACCGYPTLPLNGTPVGGALNMNTYNYYQFTVPSWGTVQLTNSVASGSSLGMWTYVGDGYPPRDGRSDWGQGAIAGYPAEFSVENADPNSTYYVGVQGIGPSETYKLTATFNPTPPAPPIVLQVNDQPTTGQSDGRQYSDFVFTATHDGNFTVAAYFIQANGDYVLLASPATPPRLGKYVWDLRNNKLGAWQSLTVPFARNGDKYFASVTSSSASTFYIRVTT